MQAVVSAFEERVQELNKFLSLLRALDDPDVVLLRPNKKSHRTRKVDADSFKILKATAFIIIYNLVESSVRDGVGAIYEEVKIDNCTVASLEDRVRRMWVEQAFAEVEKDSATLRTFRDKAQEIVSGAVANVAADLRKDRLGISGNLDAKKIRELCRKHGISERTHRAAQGGGNLETVRKNRNALSHGDVRFSECGRDYTVDALEGIAKQAVIFTRSVLGNMRRYIRSRSYRAV